MLKSFKQEKIEVSIFYSTYFKNKKWKSQNVLPNFYLDLLFSVGINPVTICSFFVFHVIPLVD